MWAAGSRGWGCAANGAFNVTPARYGVSKPGWPTFLSCGCLACCRSKKKICCPAEDRFVIVNCQWRSSEGPEVDGRLCFAGVGAGCCYWRPVFGTKDAKLGGTLTTTDRPATGCSVSFASLGDEKLGWRCVVCRFCSACFCWCPRDPISWVMFCGVDDIANPVEHSSSFTFCYCLDCLASLGLLQSGRFIAFTSDTSHHPL